MRKAVLMLVMAISFHDTVFAQGRPSICQAKAAYLEFLIASREQGMSETALIDYDRQINPAWKENARRRVYDDADLVTQDMGQVIYKFYSRCNTDQVRQPPGQQGNYGP